MKVEIIIPAIGESIAEADIISWYKSDGDVVKMDEPLLELETDKATMDLSAAASGLLTILVQGGTVHVGDVLGTISSIEPGAAQPSKKAGKGRPKSPEADTGSEGDRSKSKQAQAVSYATGHPSPAAEILLKENKLDSSRIIGTGKAGRITYANALAAAKGDDVNSKKSIDSDGDKRGLRKVKMTRLRKTVAQRLVQTQQTGAFLTTFNEIDMTGVIEIRNKEKGTFKEKHRVKLGFMSFFVQAVCQALQSFPIMNASVEEDEIIYHEYCDLGIAVSTPKGLVVPVIRNAETLSPWEIEQVILDLSTKGREGGLSLEELSGGTFTITNGGIFGSMLSTPIVNRPQSAILGMHNIVERPVAHRGQVEIRPIMYVAVTYDHRIIDGADAVKFLIQVKGRLEDSPDALVKI